MIMEFRTYTMLPGTRSDFVAYFEAEAIPRMRAAGMTVLGQFSSVTDETVFAYARTFASIEERERQYRAFYESEDWLGWMIDTAIGKEESFIVFLGDSQPQDSPPVSGLSGVHSARFTLASARGTVAAVTPARTAPAAAGGSVTVDGDDGVRLTFAVDDTVKVFSTPNGRGMTPAVPGTLADVLPGDHVLILGAATDTAPVARQIVRRPPRA